MQEAIFGANAVVHHHAETKHWVLCEDRYTQDNAINHFAKTASVSSK